MNDDFDEFSEFTDTTTEVETSNITRDVKEAIIAELFADMFKQADEYITLNSGERDCRRGISVTNEYNEAISDFCHKHRISQPTLIAAGMAFVSQITDSNLTVRAKRQSYDWDAMIQKALDKS